ncbi:MAG: tetratricopeptide repeat protein [Planctomycetaceae bacterium]
MSFCSLVRIRRCGLVAAALLSAGCASTGAGSIGGEETAWQKMIPGNQAASAIPTPAPSKYLEPVQVKIGETPAPSKIKNPAKLNMAYGRWQEQMGQLTEARRSYDLVLKEEPKSVDAILGIARLDQLGGRVREAEAGFLRAAKLKPNDPNVHDSVGQFYAANEKWPEAIKWTESALSLAKTQPDKADAATIEFHLASVKAHSGDLPGSLPHFAKSVGEAEGHFNIGYILYEKGQHAAAAIECEQALRMRPDLQQAQALLDEIRLGQAGGVQQTSAVNRTASTAAAQSAPNGAAPERFFRPVKLGMTSETRPATDIPNGTLPPSVQAPQGNRPPQTSSAPLHGATISADFSEQSGQAQSTLPQQPQWQNQYGAGHQR